MNNIMILNLIYKNNENTQHMIVEAQFLLKFLLKAKKMGHKLYIFNNTTK